MACRATAGSPVSLTRVTLGGDLALVDDPGDGPARGSGSASGALTSDGPTPNEDHPVASTPCPAADGSSPSRQDFDEAPPMCIDASKRYTATMQTSMGSLTIALDAAMAPNTVNNFVVLARYHYYDGIVFHRVIDGFMCQGGDPTGSGRGGPGYQFSDELPAPGRLR